MTRAEFDEHKAHTGSHKVPIHRHHAHKQMHAAGDAPAASAIEAPVPSVVETPDQELNRKVQEAVAALAGRGHSWSCTV